MNTHAAHQLCPPSAGAGTHIELVERTGHEDVAWVHIGRWKGAAREHLFEFVDGCADGLPRTEKWVINISTQLGCPVGCHFCDSGRHFDGDLTAEQMLEQVRFVLASRPGLAPTCGKLKVHFSRMGEPSLNPAVLVALARLPEVVASPGLWACVATSAPAVAAEWFYRLIPLVHCLYPGRFQLQFSVNSTDESQRQRLMPVPLLPLTQLASLSKQFYRPGDRKVVLNFALAQGMECDPRMVSHLFDPACCAVKLTPVNPTTAGREHGLQTLLRSQQEEQVHHLAEKLRSHGFDVVLSVGDPEEDRVGSNCGQSVLRMRQRELGPFT